MERSFTKEVALLRKGAGEVFEGEGILAITKGLLQAGVSYVTGYQGAPVSHLMDVLSDAKPLLDELGVHFAPAANEAGAASMLAASINYPMRGAAVWKSTVGTNVASDALSNLASAGVKGGAVIIVGEDYGEGASIIQERTHAFAMKSSMWLMDPRPDHARIVDLIAEAFDLSEASHAPVMMEFRIRACHVHGRFRHQGQRQAGGVAQPQARRRPISTMPASACRPRPMPRSRTRSPTAFPPRSTSSAGANSTRCSPGPIDEIGIICQGGLYNSLARALAELGLADAFGAGADPDPLPQRHLSAGERRDQRVLRRQARGADGRGRQSRLSRTGGERAPAQGRPQHRNRRQERAADGRGIHRRGDAARASRGSSKARCRSGVDLVAVGQKLADIDGWKSEAQRLIGAPVPKRPPGFCAGCPERPVFSAIKLVERDLGRLHVAADIGCHTFSTLPPFNIGNSVLGYGLGLSSAAGVAPGVLQARHQHHGRWRVLA